MMALSIVALIISVAAFVVAIAAQVLVRREASAMAATLATFKSEADDAMTKFTGEIESRLDHDEAEIELATPVIVKTQPMKPDKMVKFDYDTAITEAVKQHEDYVASRKPGHPPFHYDQMVEAVAARVVRSAAAIGFGVDAADVAKRVRVAVNKPAGEE
jgi:hypothetical protein